ncbi:hypothetical protein Tco_0454232 [Tanacetum coccineum]
MVRSTPTIHPKQQYNPHNDKPEKEEQEEKDDPENIKTNPSSPPDPSVAFITEKVHKLNSFFKSLGLVPQSSNTEFVCTKGDDDDVMFIEIIKLNDDSHVEEPEVGENTRVGDSEVEYFDIFPTRSELANHKHVHVEKAYSDLNSPLNVMTRMLYNGIMRRKLDPRENTNGGVNNFTGRIKGMHVFVGNFTYVTDFMIIEDISSIIDPRLSQVVLRRPFVEISNMTHDPPEDLERKHTKSVYLRNEEDKRRGVEYVMSKILGFYKECIELGPGYLTRIVDEGEVTLYFMRRSLEVLRKFH